MKKITMSVLMLAAVAFVMPSCKKGENDPAISFKSRDSRMAGEWSLTKMSSEDKDVDVDVQTNNTSTTTTTTTVALENGTETTTVTEVQSNTATGYDNPTHTTTTTMKKTIDMVLDKDGNATVTSTSQWVSTVNTASGYTTACPSGFTGNPQTSGCNGTQTQNATTVSTSTDEQTGFWRWMDSGKNKVEVSIDNLGMFRVDQLKSKELILMDASNSSTKTSTSADSNTSEYKGTWTFEAK